MSKLVIEMVIEGEQVFQESVDYEVVQLMMQADYITVNMNTVRVHAKEVTSKGVVRFYGVHRKPEDQHY
ncbi:hypothetical protein CEF21_12460 [Bacillus sp. FJAT-42376]|uniref:hypothetical protein n=1 Tax=Bacillus sp. FJAT-42376 TaxID=2014076 RepID=UPI000F4F8AFF|nr:hypothetical protein [Bacillus sp. FJAT-42376]AZB43050.1 hypothetical protein CEF21_12460 [Bacillus sp. FJAT-42376]